MSLQITSIWDPFLNTFDRCMWLCMCVGFVVNLLEEILFYPLGCRLSDFLLLFFWFYFDNFHKFLLFFFTIFSLASFDLFLNSCFSLVIFIFFYLLIFLDSREILIYFFLVFLSSFIFLFFSAGF